VVDQAMWQRVAVTDQWYRATRAAGRSGPPSAPADTLAARCAAADELPGSAPRAAELTWRRALVFDTPLATAPPRTSALCRAPRATAAHPSPGD
jgi:hypothetical protein